MTQQIQPTSPAFKSFMTQLIDYAGLFPPAKLPLAEAFKNYITYCQTNDAWMLSRFIIPASRLEALQTLLKDDTLPEITIPLSVLGRSGETKADFFSRLQADLAAVRTFQQGLNQTFDFDITMFEVRLPASILDNPTVDTTLQTLDQAIDLLQKGGFRYQFYEVPPGQNWQVAAQTTIQALATYRTEHTPSETEVGFKLRCGGVVSTAFPSPTEVAWTLFTCGQTQVPLKATAGLHHPIRHFNESVQAKMHGFINLFGAGILAQTHALTQVQIQAILEDETASHFSFKPQSFAWQGLETPYQRIAQARKNLLISYGSCSFDEPREDLTALSFLKSDL